MWTIWFAHSFIYLYSFIYFELITLTPTCKWPDTTKFHLKQMLSDELVPSSNKYSLSVRDKTWNDQNLQNLPGTYQNPPESH